MQRHHAPLFLSGNIEKSVRHAQWFKNMLAKVLLQSLPADFLDQPAKPVRIDSILPARSGIERQRRFQKAVISLTRTGDSPSGYVVLHFLVEKLVHKTGCVRKQLPHR